MTEQPKTHAEQFHDVIGTVTDLPKTLTLEATTVDFLLEVLTDTIEADAETLAELERDSMGQTDECIEGVRSYLEKCRAAYRAIYEQR